MIAQLFVPVIGPDAKPVYENDVGAHAVRLHRNGQWEVVVVDDYFPVQIDNPANKVQGGGGGGGGGGGSQTPPLPPPPPPP